MPATPPILELITDNIVATLAAISQQAGYSVNLSVEEPSAVIGNKRMDAKVVVIQDPAEEIKVGQGPAGYWPPLNRAGYWQPFTIAADVLPWPGATPADMRQKGNQIGSDIVRALIGTRSSRTRGGYAIDTTCADGWSLEWKPGSLATVIEVHVRVWYETLKRDPTRQ